jgi:hypothetical protein
LWWIKITGYFIILCKPGESGARSGRNTISNPGFSKFAKKGIVPEKSYYARREKSGGRRRESIALPFAPSK